jgi:hypothetical protein
MLYDSSVLLCEDEHRSRWYVRVIGSRYWVLVSVRVGAGSWRWLQGGRVGSSAGNSARQCMVAATLNRGGGDRAAVLVLRRAVGIDLPPPADTDSAK